MIPSAGRDKPDVRDRQRRDLFGAVKDLPSQMFLPIWIDVQDQSKHKDTKMACNIYSFWQIENIFNKNSDFDCRNHWINGFIPFVKDKYSKLWVDPLTDWSWKQDWMKYMKSKGFFDGYVLCSSAQEIKEAIASGNSVQTGSKQINWTKTKKNNNIAFWWGGSGHFFSIVWYDDRKGWFICINSYWENKYDKGYFYIKYSDFDLLYSAHEVIDKINLTPWQLKKQKIRQKWREYKNQWKEYKFDSVKKVFRWM